MGWKIIFAPVASDDLRDLVSYIARDNSSAALRVGEEIVSRIEALSNFPESGRIVPEFKNRDIREIICRSYRIIYRLRHDFKVIEVARIWHGARGTPKLYDV